MFWDYLRTLFFETPFRKHLKKMRQIKCQWNKWKSWILRNFKRYYFCLRSHLFAVSPGWVSTSAPSTPWSSTSSWTEHPTLARLLCLGRGPELWPESACCHSRSSRHALRCTTDTLASDRPFIWAHQTSDLWVCGLNEISSDIPLFLLSWVSNVVNKEQKTASV